MDDINQTNAFSGAIWKPQAGPQTYLLECPVYDIFFGGARGGGKSDGMLGEWVQHAMVYGKHARGLMVRREYEQVLKFLLPRMRDLFLPLGAVWRGEERYWQFPNGASLYVRHLDKDSDADGFQGDSYTRIYFEELTNFPTSVPVDKMHAVLRSPHRIPLGFRATGNPGGVGHSWVRERYIDPVPPLVINQVTIEGMSKPITRCFIPSKLTDNKILTESDPDYADRLRLAGTKELVKAWLDGDWDIVSGAAYDINKQKHMVRRFTVPSHWTRFMAIDWGFVKPYAVAWFAVCEGGAIIERKGDIPEMYIPHGALVMYRELYGFNGKANQGSREEAPVVARKILELEGNEKIDYRIGDTGMWARNDGPSVQERMSAEGVTLGQSKKDRAANYVELCTRLTGEEGHPMIYFMSDCKHFWRTVPSLVLDDREPEKGHDTQQEDHMIDAVLYAISSRPPIRTLKQRVDSLFFGHRRKLGLDGSGDPYRNKWGQRKADKKK